MSSDQVAWLAATIEVLTGAVHFLVAERVAAQPEPVQDELLWILERAFSMPPRPEEALGGRAALAQPDLARWMPIVAAGMIDAVHRQLGRESEVPHRIEQERAGLEHPAAANGSEVAERAGREHARHAVAHFERGRAVA